MSARRTLGATALVLALVAVTAAVAVAITASTTVQGGAVTQVKAARSNFTQSFTDDGGATTATDLVGAATSVNVASGKKALLLIRFSADTACYGGTSGGYDSCYVRALVDGKVVAPGEVAFDNNNNNTEAVTLTQRDAHAMEWARTVGAGTHTVQVQVRTDESGCCLVRFDLDHWVLTVERITI